MIARDQLHTILDSIPQERLDTAREALAALADPLLLALLNAPEDDEPLTEEDLAAIAEGRAEMERGELVLLDDLVARESAETCCRGDWHSQVVHAAIELHSQPRTGMRWTTR